MTTALQRMQTVDLTQAAVIRTKDGKSVKLIQNRANLSTQDETLVKLPFKDPVYIPSAKGYRVLGSLAGLVTEIPDTVRVNGVDQPNGYKDPQTGVIYWRARAGGYTKLGLPEISDVTVSYDTVGMRMQDFLAKADDQRYSKYFCITPAGKEYKPESGGPWAHYELDDGMWLWADCSAPMMAKWRKEMKNRENHSDRTCQTFAKRNAIANHPNLADIQAKHDIPDAQVKVTCWFSPDGGMRWDGSTMDVAKMLGEGAVVHEATVDAAEEAVMVRAEESVDLDEGSCEPDDPFAPAEPVDVDPAPEPTKAEKQKTAMVALLGELRKRKKRTWAKKCDDLELDPEGDLESFPVEKLVALVEEMRGVSQ